MMGRRKGLNDFAVRFVDAGQRVSRIGKQVASTGRSIHLREEKGI